MLKEDIPILIASSRKLRVVSYDRVYRKSVDKIRKWISINLLCTSPRWCDAAAISPALCCVAAQMGANNSSVQNEATASGVFAHSAVFAHAHNVASVRHFNALLLECCDSERIYCQS